MPESDCLPEGNETGLPSDLEPKPPQSQPQYYKPTFTGSAREYFRIWIVNTFLTIITVGIYAAWAKVRARNYFYSHTFLAGQPFDYLANPSVILKGYLIIGAGLLINSLAKTYKPAYVPVLAVFFYAVMPFLIYKSLRFFARNSAFRHIRFRFIGTLKGCYGTYFLIPILIPFTLGLIVPYWEYLRKRYFYSNLAFGSAVNCFSGTYKPFYKYYGVAFLIALGAFLAILGAFGTLTGLAVWIFKWKPGSAGIGKWTAVIMALPFYFIFFTVFTFFQQYLYARVTNYCMEHSKLGDVRFQSTLKARKLFWIRFTNILAIIFSLGLLAPWAKVRRMRYLLDNLTLITERNLDEFTATADSDVSAMGDAAADFFDLDIGL